MSTRSGTRIHKSFHETIDIETEVGLKSERKTRSRRLKENCDALNISLPKVSKQNKYVRYPSEEDSGEPTAAPQPPRALPARNLRNNILKALNTDVSDSRLAEKINDDIKEKPATRLTRRARKFVDDVEDDNTKANTLNTVSQSIKGISEVDAKAPEVVKQPKKSKKSKRKKLSSENEEEHNTESEGQAPQKKTLKKKKGVKKSSPMVVEDLVPQNTNVMQKSLINTSIESFHSAAGSPQETNRRRTPKKETKNFNGTFGMSPAVKKTKKDDKASADTTLTKESEAPVDNILDYTSKSKTMNVQTQDITFDLSKDQISDNTLTNLNATFDKDEPRTAPQKTIEEKQKVTKCNDTDGVDRTDQFSTTSDLPRQASYNRLSNVGALNATFDKLSDISNHSGTKTLNSTYDKVDKNCTSSPASPSLITSNNAERSCLTFDKSNENMERISLTSDDSKSSSENILNTTPVLIESSMESSRLSEIYLKPPTPNAASESAAKQLLPPTTPLKREGTFTKDGPDVIIVTSPRKSKSTDSPANVTTPAKRNMSLPSPGCTPFYSSCKVPPREKSIMNRTHSIEKATTRQSSLDEPGKPPRVMFCSPVDNPVLNTERKTKIIKSSIKGSNKSFLFDEKGAATPRSAAAGRKRSWTQSDAEQLGAKRKRLTEDLQNCVDRLSRPRTCSATAKPPEPSLPLAPSTGRSKLPNFAALHQRRFQKMESLDECQERKAKRARRMLAPTGGLAVLERSSPRPSEAPKSAPRPAAKPEPPKPTHTRFGFKLNLSVNPFSIPSKHPEPKPAESKPCERQPKRQFAPSLAGATSRQEAARRAVAREKSSAILRQRRAADRDETRTVIKGVRTNRRFELQMRARNIN